MLEIEWNGETLCLSPERAVWWPRASAVIIADPHFGKAATFRASGVYVPRGTTRANLERLSRVLDATKAQRLIILGDFLHAKAGRSSETMDEIVRWRNACRSLEIVLVRGNHDRSAGDPPTEMNIECVDEPWLDERTEQSGAIAFAHHPECARDDVPTMVGHVHPVLRLREHRHGGLRFACFHFTDRIAYLPAFGEFTGGAPIHPTDGDRIFPITPDGVRELQFT